VCGEHYSCSTGIDTRRTKSSRASLRDLGGTSLLKISRSSSGGKSGSEGIPG